MPFSSATSSVPPRGGVGLKAPHYRTIIETRPDIGFFEVHAENYMGAGGPPHRYLAAIRERYPLSLHGVGLSIGADRPLDCDHLQRLKDLIARYAPGLFSEHLAWSSHDAGFFNDLLPVPYGRDAWAGLQPYRPNPGSARPADAAGESVNLSQLCREHLFGD